MLPRLRCAAELLYELKYIWGASLSLSCKANWIYSRSVWIICSLWCISTLNSFHFYHFLTLELNTRSILCKSTILVRWDTFSRVSFLVALRGVPCVSCVFYIPFASGRTLCDYAEHSCKIAFLMSAKWKMRFHFFHHCFLPPFLHLH